MNQWYIHPRSYFIIMVVLLNFWLLPPSHAEQIDNSNISINLSLTTNTISLNEPVLINLIIKNLSATAINMALGPRSNNAIEFSIKSMDDTLFKRYKFPDPWGTAFIRSIELAAGESYQDILILDKWHILTTPGLYNIQAIVVAPLTLSERPQFVDSNMMQLQITPRNKKRLSKRADELLAIALSKTHTNFSDTAQRLSYLRDPEAIAAFEQLLLTNDIIKQRYGAQGLVRIADLQSTNVLIKYQDRFESRNEKFITNALSKIARTSAIPQIIAIAQSAVNKYPYKQQSFEGVN